MSLLIGFLVFCACAWIWLLGSAFAAFVASLGGLWLVAIGAGDAYCHSGLLRSVLIVAAACGPWLVRTQILEPRSLARYQRVDLSHLGRPETYTTRRPGIPD